MTPVPAIPPCAETDLGCIPTTPIGFVEKFYGIGLGMLGTVSLLFIIYAGYLIMTSSGNQQQVQVAKSYLFYAIAGLLLAIFGFVFIQIVFVQILQIPGFS